MGKRGRAQSSHGPRVLRVSALLARPCACLARVCFQQFAEETHRVEAIRQEFQGLPREKKESCSAN